MAPRSFKSDKKPVKSKTKVSKTAKGTKTAKAGKGSKEPKRSKVADLVTVNLAAHYRPSQIEDYVGQDSIIKTFRGWQKTGRVPASILIHGNLGSGKTTLARLIARYVNCETFSACGECPSCKMGINGHPDILQYDMGGDAGKVDGSRAMVDSAHLSPMFNRRVFILDESHLMSSQAESALLVALEEPPEGTMWIMCTTNPEKMKPTMLSRCTTLAIQPIEPEIIYERLVEISKREGIYPKGKAERKDADKALKLLSTYSEGQMRKAIGLLQNLSDMIAGGEEFSASTVTSALSSNPEVLLGEKAVQMVAAFVEMDLLSAIQFLREAGDARGILHKSRWLLTNLIGHFAGTNKFQTAELKMFLNLAKKEKLKYTLPPLIYLQRALAQVEVTINSTSVPADVVLESEICSLMCEIYEGKVIVE